MGTLTTKLSIRSNNVSRNRITQRHDRLFNIEDRVDNGVRVITTTSISSPTIIAAGSDYYDSTETGDIANQVYVFIRNVSKTYKKTITLIFNKNGTRDDVALLNNGEFIFIPWKCDASTDNVELICNDSTGVKIEYLIAPMK
jgi:hypothetical protein